MSNLVRKLGYGILAAVCVSLTQTAALSGAIAEDRKPQGEFRVTPVSFAVDMTVQEPVTLQVELENPFAEDLNFSLSLVTSADSLSAVGLKAEADAGNGKQELNQNLPVIVSTGGKKTLKLILTPEQKKDYNLDLEFKLVQEQSERKLEQPEYKITVKVGSKIASKGQINYQEMGAVAAIAFGLLILLILISSRINKEDGKESN